MHERRQLFDDLIRFETELWDAVDERLRADVELPLSWFEPMTIMNRISHVFTALGVSR